MGFFNKYPYTNEHELNLDWIIAKINALKDRVKAVEDAIHDIVVVTPNNGKLTIKRNNTIIGDFTADQATDEDINIVVPENTSDLNNDSDFITSSDLPDMNNYYDKTETDTLLGAKADTSSLATVATTGNYNDLSNKPSIPAAQVNSDWNANSGVAQILNKPSLATVATTGNYNDLSNKPTIPAAQVNSDWNANSGVAQILNKPSLATVATSGSYDDLSNKPTIPTVNNGTLTIQKNGSTVRTFTANASSNVTCNITCENKISWTASGKWSYWKDSTNTYHLSYNSGSVSINYNASIGNVYYRSSTYNINLPVTLTSLAHINATILCNGNICGVTVHSYNSSQVKLWLWCAQSGTRDIQIMIDLVST